MDTPAAPIRCAILACILAVLHTNAAEPSSLAAEASLLERCVKSVGAKGILPSIPAGDERIAAWMAKYGDSVRGASRSDLPVKWWGCATERDDKAGGVRHIYLHVFRQPADGVIIVPIGIETITACRALTEACAPLAHTGGASAFDTNITLPKTLDPLDSVIEVIVVR